MVKACCVPGCKSGVKVASHKFPKDPERCSQWIESLKLHELNNYCAQDLQKFKVCHKHFSKEKDYSCCARNRFLIKTAIPVIIAENNIDTMSNNLQHVQSQNEQSQVYEHIEQCNQVSQSSHNENMLLQKLTNIEKKMQEHDQLLMQHQDLLMQNNVNLTLKLTQQNEISGQEIKSMDVEFQNKAMIDNNNNNNNVQKNTEQSSSTRKNKHVRPNLQNVTRVKNLGPEAKSLYNVNIKLKRSNRYLKRLINGYKEKAKKKSISLVHTNSTTAVREKFINMIIRNNDVPPQVFNVEYSANIPKL